MRLVTFNTEALANQVLDENDILFAKIKSALQCSDHVVGAAMCEVVRFLFLVSRQATGRLTPSHRVDLAWHEFILCTHAYQEFCMTHFGRFIHHFPGGSTELNKAQFQQTLRCYQQEFGPPDPAFWSSMDTEPECGACESI